MLALLVLILFDPAGITVAIGFGLAQLIPVWLAISVAALAWTGGCAIGGYAVAAAGAASLSRIDL